VTTGAASLHGSRTSRRLRRGGSPDGQAAPRAGRCVRHVHRPAVGGSLLADVPAVEPTPLPQEEEPDPGWRADGARVVEREAVALGIPSEGGTSLAGEALDPSVDIRGTPTIEGLPADVTPADATELTGWRTEHSRSILNPDGTITAEYSGGRLNYLDPNGAWQPLDLSLVLASARLGDNWNWIQGAMDQGRRIVDRGPAPGNPRFPNITSDAYSIELHAIESRGYPNVEKWWDVP
jgi:hypothetical protein